MMSQAQSNVQVRNCILYRFTIEDGLTGTQLTSLPSGSEMENNHFELGGKRTVGWFSHEGPALPRRRECQTTRSSL